MKYIIFSEDTNFRNDILRMEDHQYDIMIRYILDIMKHLENNGDHLVLKGNYEVDNTIMGFMCRVAS